MKFLIIFNNFNKYHVNKIIIFINKTVKQAQYYKNTQVNYN